MPVPKRSRCRDKEAIPRDWARAWRSCTRATASLGILLGVLSSVTVGCQPFQHLAASAIVDAPNRGALPKAPLQGEIPVAVGPPSATLSVEIVDEKTPRATVFVLHGIRADRRSVRQWGHMLADAGFRAVLVDLRGHGRSTGDWLSYGVVESRDLAQVLDALEACGLRIGSVGVMGLSYGAAIAIEWAGIDPRIEAVVAIAPFASLRDVVPEYAPAFLSSSFVSGAIDMAGRQGDFDPDEASPLLAMGRTQVPVLLIHGRDDHRIPARHSQRLFAARAEHTELLLVPGAGHLSIADDPVVRERAPAWFALHLRPTALVP